MSKRLLMMSCAVLLVGMMAFSSPVTVEQARNEAIAFVQSAGGEHGKKLQANVQQMQLAASSDYYYVFNIGVNNGFLIVSGDDRTVPILGYSSDGSFVVDKMPIGMKELLDDYKSQIQSLAALSDAQAQQRLAAPRRAVSVVPTRNSVAPLVTTNWDQATPYWNHCPQFMNSDNEDDGYELAYTGCVATAMSQVMKFHNWPVRPTKTIPSYSVTYYLGNYNYGTFNTDELAPIDFDWAHMKDNYTGAEDEVYTEAVSWLMLYVGCAAHMQYGTSASGTSDPYIPKAFREYFDYDARLVYRSDYDQTTWDEMIYQELAAGRPLIYNGRAGSGGGHSFVCDGYEYDGYFHINWGWGGLGNGYFILSVLNPSEAGIGASSSSEGYNIDQTAIVGIKPGYTGASDDVQHLLTVYNMYYSGNRTLERGDKGFSFYKRRLVKVTAEDHIDDGTKYKRGIALYDSNDNFIELIASSSYYSSSLSITDSWPDAYGSTYYYFGKNISNGIYKIKPVCQVEGSSSWEPMLESDRYFIEVSVSGDYATLTDHPVTNLTAVGFEFEGEHKAGISERCHVAVRNNSTDRFNGRLYFYLTNEQIDEYGEYLTVVEAEIPAGETRGVTFNFTPQNAGAKTAQLSLYDSSTGGSKIPGTGSVDISGSSALTPMNLSVVIAADNAVGTTLYDSYANFKVDITNNGTGDYDKYVLAPLFIITATGGQMVTYKQADLSIKAGETKTLYFNFDNLAYGERYALNIYGRNENDSLKNLVKSGESIIYNVEHGVVVWTEDGQRIGSAASSDVSVPANALAVRLEGCDVTTVHPNANPNTIYLLGGSQATPAGLEGKNVVYGQTADAINLHDGYSYLIPQSVNAASVAYHRTFAHGRKADERAAWSTMVLPFAPSAVLAGGQTAVLGSDLWVYGFANEEDGKVVFEPAEGVKANVPYLVAVADGREMTGKDIVWEAANVVLKASPIAYTSGEDYLMAATYLNQSVEKIYAMDSQGTRFVMREAAQQIAPFRAYFKALRQQEDEGVILCPGTTDVSPVLKGDVNNDGVVDVTDVNIIINIILGKDEASNYDDRAFVTDDEVIDIADINAVINIIMSN